MTASSSPAPGVWRGAVAEFALRGAGATFTLTSASTWRAWHWVAWAAVVVAGLEIWTELVHVLGAITRARRIAVRGKHLDRLEAKDLAFLTFNKLATAVFSYHLARLAWLGGSGVRIAWGGVAGVAFGGAGGGGSVTPPSAIAEPAAAAEGATLANTAGALVLLYVVYDFFYTLFHRALHHRSVYKYVHKHHHRQKAPSRGNADAINVHPLEFVTGEYNHLLALWVVSRFMTPVHVYAVATFILLGGFLASLNHTRFDLRMPLFPQVYQVRFHDIHHWYPDSNYGQYTMLWDRVFGWFKPYPIAEEDDDSGGFGSGNNIRGSNGRRSGASEAASRIRGAAAAANGGAANGDDKNVRGATASAATAGGKARQRAVAGNGAAASDPRRG